MAILALDFPQWQILFGFALAGFFTGVGSELSKYIIGEYIIKHTERGIVALTNKLTPSSRIIQMKGGEKNEQ